MMVELFIIIAGVTYFSAKCIGENLRSHTEKQYIAQKGFNLKRQKDLERMMTSLDPEERMRFNRLLGRTAKLKDGGYDAILAVRQISLREGWQYYYVPELGSDPKFVKISGGKWPKWETPGRYPAMSLVGKNKAVEMNEETDRRASWIERCPHGNEVEVFPMDFQSEDEYRNAVKRVYERISHANKEDRAE